jgi:hypothetical protein
MKDAAGHISLGSAINAANARPNAEAMRRNRPGAVTIGKNRMDRGVIATELAH